VFPGAGRHAGLLRETGLEDQISDEGCLSLYTDEAEFKADRDHIEILERFGFPHEVIGRQAIKALEPELSDRIGLAVLFPQNRSMKDPYKLVLALAERVHRPGGPDRTGEVVGFTRGRMREVVLKDGRTPARRRGGDLRRGVLGPAGEPAGRADPAGNRTRLSHPDHGPGHHDETFDHLAGAKAFMVTPTAGGIRVGGTVEMAGLDAAPDYRRSKITVKRAREALPNLRCEDAPNGWATARRCPTRCRSCRPVRGQRACSTPPATGILA
jgi:D-amino-acid dehydrogenase